MTSTGRDGVDDGHPGDRYGNGNAAGTLVASTVTVPAGGTGITAAAVAAVARDVLRLRVPALGPRRRRCGAGPG
ncbi:hypothetical protein SIN09_34625, partial [Streptomyces sp. F8]|nr:hypothetical protein [Streptomyces sp. F8]